MKTCKEVLESNDSDVDGLYGQFLQVVVNGGGYQGIADFMAQELNAGVFIEDQFFRVLGRSFFTAQAFVRPHKRNGITYWKPQREDPKIVPYVRLVESGRPVEMPELPEYGINQSRLVFPIVLKNKIKGQLHVFKNDFNWDRVGMFVRAALHSLVVMETCRQTQVDLEEKIKKNLILSLTSNTGQEFGNLYGEKQILGFDVYQKAILSVIQMEPAGVVPQIEEALRSIISDLDINAISTAVNEHQVVLLLQSADGHGSASSEVAEYIQVIFDALKIIFAECRIIFGVGRPCSGPQDYKVSFAEACKAITLVAPQSGLRQGLIYYHSMRLMGLLVQPGNEQILPGFVRVILGKLHAYDVTHNTALIDNLACYLDHNSCIQSAATHLFIHPNTLRYRLEKIARVSGLDLADTDTKLEVQVALRLYKYYGNLLWEN